MRYDRVKTRLDYVRCWLILAAIVFAVGSPFIIFLHFFGGKWLALLAMSISLASYYTLVVWQVNRRQKRQ